MSEQFLVKLAYKGLKPEIQQIVVPQIPVSMSDFLSKSTTAEMTVNMVKPQQNSILKAVSSIEDKIMNKISQRLDSIAAISLKKMFVSLTILETMPIYSGAYL